MWEQPERKGERIDRRNTETAHNEMGHDWRRFMCHLEPEKSQRRRRGGQDGGRMEAGWRHRKGEASFAPGWTLVLAKCPRTIWETFPGARALDCAEGAPEPPLSLQKIFQSFQARLESSKEEGWAWKSPAGAGAAGTCISVLTYSQCEQFPLVSGMSSSSLNALFTQIHFWVYL